MMAPGLPGGHCLASPTTVEDRLALCMAIIVTQRLEESLRDHSEITVPMRQ